jgi:hypothetical protein
MGRIFLYVGEAGAINEAVEEALIRIGNLVADDLRSRGFRVLDVPDELELTEAITWINRRARPDDVALAIQLDAFFNPEARGASAFYIANNQERREQAELLLRQLLEQVPALVSRGAKPDTETALGDLAFTRQVAIPSLVLNIGFATNPTDRSLILNRPQEIAQGIADGVATWSRAVADEVSIPPSYPPINISINGRTYGEQGIIVNGNSYIPVDIVDQLDIQLREPTPVRLITYGNVTYIRAIDLRQAGVFVGWDPITRTVILRTIQPFDPDQIGEIIGPGFLSQAALEAYLRSVNPEALEQFPEIAQLYLEEAAIEGVNPDVAFAQALKETNFFRFDNGLSPLQNNFGGLGAVGGSGEGATFPSARLGVRAHIQHLKAYGNREPLVQDVVDPRFRFVARGTAPRVELLSNRWSADPLYGEKVLAILRRLYQSAGLL